MASKRILASTAPIARFQLPLPAAATQKRTLEAVGCRPLLGAGPAVRTAPPIPLQLQGTVHAGLPQVFRMTF